GRLEFDGVNVGKQAAVEVIDAGVATGAGGVGIVHLAEQAADEVVGGGAALAFVQQPGEEVLGEQADVLGEHSDDALEDEAAGADAVFAAEDERVESVSDVFGGFAGDLDPVVLEQRGEGAREKEVERGVPGRQL